MQYKSTVLSQLKKELENLKNPEKAKILARFFKTGKGEYGEGYIFYGVMVPVQRQIAKKYAALKLMDLQILLKSRVHEYRLTSLFILISKYKEANKKVKE